MFSERKERKTRAGAQNKNPFSLSDIALFRSTKVENDSHWFGSGLHFYVVMFSPISKVVLCCVCVCVYVTYDGKK